MFQKKEKKKNGICYNKLGNYAPCNMSCMCNLGNYDM